MYLLLVSCYIHYQYLTPVFKIIIVIISHFYDKYKNTFLLLRPVNNHLYMSANLESFVTLNTHSVFNRHITSKCHRNCCP